MSVSLSLQRDRIQRQVERLEQSLSVTHTDLELLSSETDDASDDDNSEEESEPGLLAQRKKIQKEIQHLESVLGQHSPVSVSGDDESSSSSSSEESDLAQSLSVESCLQMNLVYQQVLQESLEQLETLLAENHRQQMEVESQLSGPTKEAAREQAPPSSCQQQNYIYLGRFLKPYFKDKLTGLGPPANQETKEKSSRMTGYPDNPKQKMKRWSSWQKTLLIHSVSRDRRRRLIQPKLSKVEYLSQKLSSPQENSQQLREQIEQLEKEINLLREKKEEELIGDRYEEHDWQKISNIDFEGTREAEDICCFWQNFLHPSVNKSPWNQQEVQQLREVSRRHQERHWESIAAELGSGRTAFLCLQTFQRFVSNSLKRSVWTPAEDELLRELVEQMRIGNFIPYTQISYFMEGREPTQLIYRWTHFLDPSLKKGPWTSEEDQLLLQAVSQYGEKDWWKIRMEVPGRHDGACRDRYFDCLKAGLKKGGFDEEEQLLFLKLVEKHGVGRWAKIAAEIPGRNDSQCLRLWKKLSKDPNQHVKKRKRVEKPVAPPQAIKEEKKSRSSRRKGRISQRRRKWEKEELEEIKEEEEAEVEYMDSDEEKEKKHRWTRTKNVEDEEEVDQVSSSQGVVEQQKEQQDEQQQQAEETYSVPPMQRWTPRTWRQDQGCSTLSFKQVELSSSSSSGASAPVRCTVLGRHGRSVFVGAPPTPLPTGTQGGDDHMAMVSPKQLRAHLRHLQDKLSRVRVDNEGALRRNGRTKATRLQLQAAVTPWIGNLLLPSRRSFSRAQLLASRWAEPPLLSTPFFRILLQAMRVDSTGCKNTIDKKKSRRWVMATQARPSGFAPVRMMNPKTIGGMLQRRVMEAKSQQGLILNQPGVAPGSAQGLRPLQAQHQVLLQLPQTWNPPTVFFPHPLHQTSPTPSIRLLTPLAPPPSATPALASLTFPSPPPPLVHLLPAPVNAVSMKPAPIFCPTTMVQPTLTYTPALVSPAPSLPGVTQTGPASRPISPPPSPPCPVGGGTLKEVEEKAVGGAEGAGFVDGRRPRKLTVKAKALMEATATKARKKKNAASPSGRNLCVSATRMTSSDLAPPPEAASTGTTWVSPLLSSTNRYSWTTLDHTYGLMSGPAHNQPSKAQTRRRKRELEEEEEEEEEQEEEEKEEKEEKYVTSSQYEAGSVGRSSAMALDGGCVRKPTQRVRNLQAQLQTKDEVKEKRSSSPSLSSPLRKRPRKATGIRNPAPDPGSGRILAPSVPRQVMLVMSPTGSVQPTQHPQNKPPKNLLAPLLQGSAHPPNQPIVYRTIPSGVATPPKRSFRPAQVLLPFKVKSDPTAPPPFRREALQFDPTLIFQEPQEVVQDWLSGRGGVRLPAAGVYVPYLPPMVTSLSTLSTLLCLQRSLTRLALQLLPGPHPPSTANQHSELSDCTSDPGPTPVEEREEEEEEEEDEDEEEEGKKTKRKKEVEKQRGAGKKEERKTEEEEEEDEEEEEEEEDQEQVGVVRQLVAKHFASNPAYQLLKARFLCSFAVPALLATLNPPSKKPANQEQHQEEEEKGEEAVKEEVVLKRIGVRGRQRPKPANQLPGIGQQEARQGHC